MQWLVAVLMCMSVWYVVTCKTVVPGLSGSALKLGKIKQLFRAVKNIKDDTVATYEIYKLDPTGARSAHFRHMHLPLRDLLNKIAEPTECYLNLNSDFGNPAPLYIWEQKGTLLMPNTRGGNFVVKDTENILVTCPGEKKFLVLNNVTQSFNSMDANCVGNKTFSGGWSWSGEFKNIKCSAAPMYLIEDLGKPCAGGYNTYRVGYKIANKFHTLYEACHDKGAVNTLFVKHLVHPTSVYLQIGKRPSFAEGDFFGNIKIGNLYKRANQRNRVNSLLGDRMDNFYITKNQFITRGHLAPRGDFTLRALQRTSFHYINVAPQWMRGNAGDWAALEDGIRRRIQSHNTSVTIYTGTHGVATLMRKDGSEEELYLSTDENGNNIVPVPLYFFKLIYDSHAKTAVGFVSINSSYYNQSRIEQLSFCNDICYGNHKFAWIRWRNDGHHSFCCEYDEFIEVIKSLPTLKVKGLFY